MSTQRPALVVFVALCAAAVSVSCSREGSRSVDRLDAETAAAERAARAAAQQELPRITVDYPLTGSIFPPEIVPPTVLWHEPSDAAEKWLIETRFSGEAPPIRALSDGRRPALVIDPKAVAPNNAWEEDEYQAASKGWTPDHETWERMKRLSTEQDLELSIWGLSAENQVVSRGSVHFRTSVDPVSAPIFYRDVPLMPAETEHGIVKPLAKTAIPLIEWRLRDISKPSAPTVMRHMPTCANCHSFSADGATLAMDMDGPSGDKGAHTIQDVAKKMVVEGDEVFSWNEFDPDPSTMSFGLFPRVSPNGRYVAATVKESVFVRNYTDFRFLQTFYPTRGIIAIYERETGKIAALPGADDPKYVQTNPIWTPDGTAIVFLRALARDSYPSEEQATYANDPLETQIQYDLCRIPFNDGKGGEASPVPGASANGKSNSFPAFSPDGKWMVYVQANNGLLMRPDSRLFILPAEGGEAREMNCNTRLMNSWHSWSPNSRWLVFSSKSRRPFTQLFLTHIDENGIDSPAVLLPGSTADNRAANLPEFANMPVDAITEITTPAVEYRRHFDRGTELLEAGRLEAARAALARSVALKDDFPESQISLGFALNLLKQPKAAIPHFKRALSLDANRAEAHQQWGNALFQSGQLDEALEQYGRATEIDAKHALAHSLMADILMKKGRPQEALERYAMAAKAKPSRPQTYCYWALALTRMGRLEEAERKLRTALELDPEYLNAMELMGQVLAQSGQSEKAIARLKTVVAREPERMNAQRNLGLLLARAGQPKASLEHLRIASTRNPKDHVALTALARALAQLGRPAESVISYRKALAAEAGYDLARNELAWLLATHPDPTIRSGEEAVRHAELACRNTRWGNPFMLHTLAAAHATMGDFDGAADVERKAMTVAKAADDAPLLRDIQHGLQLYEQRKPYTPRRD